MIVDKHISKDIKQTTNSENVQVEAPAYQEEVVMENGLIGAYQAVRKILESIPENPRNPNGPRLFKTVKLDNGQLNRIKNNTINREYGIAFPAVFIHFIDVYYNQGTSRVSEGKGVMRIHYVLNRMNNSDDDFETEGLDVFHRIVSTIEAQKSSFPALISRFQLQYWDQPLTFDDALQPYWIDYQIWFTDYSTIINKDYVDAYIVCPPFTQHSDQNEIANPDNLPNAEFPKFEDCVGIGTPTPDNV